ncbi:hypothetical protein BaRGS_00005207 [Batillaria attramentaria]|uniref:Uncharacterized protein n=1 Tax=Batillaria attramentaria TaxID=370345 RepID=A0ABD0LX35_9CAEN
MTIITIGAVKKIFATNYLSSTIRAAYMSRITAQRSVEQRTSSAAATAPLPEEGTDRDLKPLPEHGEWEVKDPELFTFQAGWMRGDSSN